MLDLQAVKGESQRVLKEAWRAIRYAIEGHAGERAPWQDITTLPQPSEISPGAQEYQPGHVSFALFAPGKKSVAVAGSFNEWSAEATPMQHLGDGLWGVAIALPDGEHRYQFVVDNDLWICDPYAREVAWDEQGPKGIVRVGHPAYQWHDEGFQPRPLHDLILYEVHVGDFTEEGTFEAMRQRLDYLQGLGITAIELMPISEFPMDRSWGYNPTFYFAPEHVYGSPDDLKRLIDEAHQRGMAVILDMVFNHVQQDNPLNLMWPYDENPYFSGSNPWGMPDFNHHSDFTKAYIRDVQDHWLLEYHIDGFRYDATAYIESDAMNGIGFITWAARQTKPAAYLIAEHLPQDPWWVANSELDAQWHDSFHDVMKAQLREGPFEGGHEWGNLDAVERAIFYALDGYQHPRDVINYVSSHDEQRVIHEVLSNPHLNEEIAQRKAKLGMEIVLCAAGVPMLYSGEEIGLNQERTTEKVLFEWERLAHDPSAQALEKHWQRLAWLRNSHPALRSPAYETVGKWGEQKVIAYKRWNEEGDVILVVHNLSNHGHKLPIPFPGPGLWHEFIHNYAVEVSENSMVEIEVPPSGSAIFCLWKNWE